MNKIIAAVLITVASSLATVSMAAPIQHNQHRSVQTHQVHTIAKPVVHHSSHKQHAHKVQSKKPHYKKVLPHKVMVKKHVVKTTHHHR